MSTTLKWVVPCYFNDKNYAKSEIEFDLTNHLHLFLKNEVWNRKFDYGVSHGLKNTNPENIKKAVAKIYPRFISGYVNESRLSEYIEKNCGIIPSHLKLNYKKWNYRLGVVIIEVEYFQTSPEIPTKKDVLNFTYKEEFYLRYHRHISLLKELASFFLAGLHLSFPTRSVMGLNDEIVDEGFFCIKSGRKAYAAELRTNLFMHHILIENDKIQNVNQNLDGLAQIWHLNLWPLKRFLISVESNRITMDNLLDLLYALEGLFHKNTSSDFIKMFCIITLCQERKYAVRLKEWLDVAFRIRNDIAHGERSYESADKVMFLGKKISCEEVYWEMKTIVVMIMMVAISKLLRTPGMKNLKFSNDDLLDVLFNK